MGPEQGSTNPEENSKRAFWEKQLSGIDFDLGTDDKSLAPYEAFATPDKVILPPGLEKYYPNLDPDLRQNFELFEDLEVQGIGVCLPTFVQAIQLDTKNFQTGIDTMNFAIDCRMKFWHGRYNDQSMDKEERSNIVDDLRLGVLYSLVDNGNNSQELNRDIINYIDVNQATFTQGKKYALDSLKYELQIRSLNDFQYIPLIENPEAKAQQFMLNRIWEYYDSQDLKPHEKLQSFSTHMMTANRLISGYKSPSELSSIEAITVFFMGQNLTGMGNITKNLLAYYVNPNFKLKGLTAASIALFRDYTQFLKGDVTTAEKIKILANQYYKYLDQHTTGTYSKQLLAFFKILSSSSFSIAKHDSQCFIYNYNFDVLRTNGLV